MKLAFESDLSPKVRRSLSAHRNLPFDHKDGDIAVNGLALVGADLWVDPQFSRAFFLCDKLVQVLNGAKLTRRLRLRKCRLV